MQRPVTTIIDNAPFQWEVEGDFSLGKGDSLYNADIDVLQPFIGALGYKIISLPDNFSEKARNVIARFLTEWKIPALETYHQYVNENKHMEIISRSRNLSLQDLSINDNMICRQLTEILGLDLSPKIADLGRDHLQVRINRPGSTDFNPPHRDGAILCFRNTVNLWIPIAGCTALSNLPVLPGSHLWREQSCLQTKLGGAKINGKSYNVPAVIEFQGKRLEMVRPPVEFGQAIVFTPYLLHGAAINLSNNTRIALELRLTLNKQCYGTKQNNTNGNVS